MANVKSSDPRKKQIVQLLRAATGASKVTNLRESPKGTFTGRCLKYENGAFTVLGEHTITPDIKTA